MNSASIILYQIVIMFILIALGFVLYKKKVFTRKGCNQLSNFVLMAVLPAVIFNAFQKEFRPELVSGLLMINDFDDVPGVGRAIITDDVYGDSLAKLISKGEVDEKILVKVNTCLVDALDYIQQNHIVHHQLTPERIIFTENIRNLKVIDVGFDQLDHLSRQDTRSDIVAFGKILNMTLDACPPEVAQRHSRCRKVAQNAIEGHYSDVQELKMALNDRKASRLGILIAIFLAIMIVVLAWLTSVVRHA